MADHLVYHAFGDRVNECRFSLLKYLFQTNLQPPHGTLVTVHTDQPSLFDDFIPFFPQFEITESKPDVIQSRIINTEGLPEFSELLSVFFQKNQEESVPNLVKLIHHIDPAQIRQDKWDYEQKPFYLKWLDRIRGKSWSVRQYEKKF